MYLTFKELEVGDRFIAMPEDFPTTRKRGWKGWHDIFEKIEPTKDTMKQTCNTRQIRFDILLNADPDEKVIRII